MAWNLDGDRPIYVQLVEILQSKIIAGEYKPGEKLRSEEHTSELQSR